MNRKVNTFYGIIILVAIGCLAFGYLFLSSQGITTHLQQLSQTLNLHPNKPSAGKQIQKFASEADFKAYLAKAETAQSYAGLSNSAPRPLAEVAAPSGMGLDTNQANKSLDTSGAAQRVSDTNVQVLGIDEPDIVKTDGQEIYFSPSQYYYYPMMGKSSAPNVALDYMPPRPQNQRGILAIKALPPTQLAQKNILNISGNLLLKDNTLVVLPDNNYYAGAKIYAYDVTDPSNPKDKWTINLGEKTSLLSARMYGEKIYLITRTDVNGPQPCPLEPMSIAGQPTIIPCTEIYHPAMSTAVDTTFNVSAINLSDGTSANNVSFVGSNSDSQVYMSTNAIYVTYFYNGDMIKYFVNFAKANQDLIPDWVVQKMTKLSTYDISDGAKMTEFYYIWQKYSDSLTSDDLLKVQNEMTNRMKDYAKLHMRELENTGIAKINVADLSMSASGNVPGRLLKQFSLDEYNNNLRVATTIGGNWWGIGLINGASDSANDVYVLDNNLNQIGSLKDLGAGESIYAVRFIENQAYLVTFKQTDPFFVLDMSDPANPQAKGQLKIPGYSSYLHPLAKNTILGVGEENGKVKLAVYDVSDPSNPSELSKYNLDEYWTDVSNNYHAFLQDKDNQVFFIPGSKGGYVFSYANNNLSLKKAVSDLIAKRAVYINNNLYMVGDNKIAVVDESTWAKVSELAY